jgi:hypothetical protein
MADLNITPDQIAKAREAGYSDDEIVNHLSTKAPEKFKGALDAGYSPTEILAHFGAAPTAPKPTAAAPEEAPSMLHDISSGFRHGVNEMVRGTQSSRKNILGTDVSDEPVDPDYKPANVTNGSWNPLKWNGRQIPKMLAEQAPITGASALGAAAGDLLGPAGAIIGGLTPLVVTQAGDNVKHRAVARSGDQNVVPNDEDKAIGIGTTLAAAVPGSIMHMPGLGGAVSAGLNGVGKAAVNLLGRGAVGAGGNVAANAVTQAGTKIGTDQPFDPSQLPEAAVTGAAGVTPHIIPAIASANRALRMGKYNADPEAAANVATRMQNTDLDLGNIHEAAQAHGKVTSDIHNELKGALSRVEQQKTLSPDEANAVAAFRRGDQITPKDMEVLQSATANAPDGANAHFLARALKTAQQLEGEGSFNKDTGWQGSATGGMKNVVRGVFNPWHIGGTMAGLGALAFGMPHVSGAVGGGLMGGLAVGLGGARLLDSITGGSRPAQNFAKTFADHNAQLRQSTAVQPPPIPQMQPTPGPWGAKPLQQQSVPQVQAPQMPQPLPQGTLPWKAPTNTELPQFNPMQLSMLKRQMAATTAQANAPAPAPEAPQLPSISPIALKMMQKSMTDGEKQSAADWKVNRQQADSENKTANADFNVNQMHAVSVNKAIDKANSEAETAAVAALKQPKITISKSKGGEVKATDPFENAGSFTPVPEERMVYRGLTPEQIGDKVSRERTELPEMNRMGLRNAVTQTHAARDAVSQDLATALPQHASLIAQMNGQLKEPGNSALDYSHRVIKHYTDQMDPASAQIVKHRYHKERENLWPTVAEKRAAARKKAKAKKED